jgi:membrane associated rhomboid family serine protease
MTSGTSARELPVTTGLLVSLFVVYLVEVALAGTGSLIAGPGPRKLVDLGAMVPLTPSGDGGALGVAAGQYWRLASSMFLHAGIIHLLMNAYGLWLFGSIEEQEMGSARLLMVYLFSGIVAAAASYAFSPLTVVAVGASGAIYGLLGAFVTYNYRRRHMRFFRARLQAVLPWIVLNLFLSFSIAFIDWRAHLAGLVAGGIAGFVAEGTGSQATRRAILVLGFAGLLAAAVALVAWRTADLRGQFPGL